METPPPRWAVRAAHLTACLALPSGLWRIALVAGLPLGFDMSGTGPGERLYIVSLSVVSELLALLTLGLVRPWGEVLPGWVPLLGGRRVGTRTAVVPALLGAAGLAFVWGFAFLNAATRPWIVDGTAQRVLFVACYLPLLAWAPLLAAVALAYHRRRTRPGAGPGSRTPTGAPVPRPAEA
ncbi:hypothetical protein [Streptomyces hoynatensis]|uniref:hypothetical protein n=1 Tax=Streptomyces hoynatensis TaxID=1141874 RepID=UPI001F4E5FD1|nr:hypothetical protein [Streptomyces hoynatensis]